MGMTHGRQPGGLFDDNDVLVGVTHPDRVLGHVFICGV
jgi:hypothetical protein